MKRTITMCLLAAGLLVAGSPAQDRKQPKKEQFVIEKFDFDWFVAESGESELIVNKTHETTRIVIRGGGFSRDSLWMLPEDASGIGTALSDVDKFYTRMRNAEADMSEAVEAGRYRVTFRFSKEYGFSVHIAKQKRFMGDSIMLGRDAAKAFAPYLLKAKAMAGFIDDKIRF